MNFNNTIAKLGNSAKDPSDTLKILEKSGLWQSGGGNIFRMASYLNEKGRYGESLALIETAELKGILLTEQISSLLYYLRGDMLLEIRDFDKSVLAYNRILALHPDQIALCNRGLAFWEKGEYSAALNDYLEAIKINSSNHIALRGAGEMLNRLDRSREAVHYLTLAVNQNPNYSAAFTALGIAYFNCEDWPNAYRALKRAVAINPNDKVAFTGIIKIEDHLMD